jgi:16S rRNA C967 or C1407 C5-methylase (RsmB/RsmF family)
MSFRDDVVCALELMPEARVSKRAKSLTLDQLLDDQRVLTDFSANALDLLMMAYRLRPAFLIEAKAFRPQGFSPKGIGDLLNIAFAALLTRDKSPDGQIVNESVEVAKIHFGAHTGPLVNAFLRHTQRTRDALKARLKTDAPYVLGSDVSRRFASEPKIAERLAQQLIVRPEAGIQSIDSNGVFARVSQSDFFSGTYLGIDLGSKLLLDFVNEQINARSLKFFVDACAAPGGKLVGLQLMRGASNRLPFLAIDSKFGRLERLNENIRKFGLNQIGQSRLHEWGQPIAFDWPTQDRSLILVDLPCSGYGTLHTRPDVLLKTDETFESLYRLQKTILQAVSKSPAVADSVVVVSICSVDPTEVKNLSGILGQEPAFSSFSQTTECCEGLVAWTLPFEIFTKRLN